MGKLFISWDPMISNEAQQILHVVGVGICVCEVLDSIISE